MNRLTRPALVVAAVALAAAGASASAEAGGRRVPLTNRAVAAVTAGHLPGKPSVAGPIYHLVRGSTGADLRYHADGEYDGDLVEVIVHPGAHGPKPCLDRGRCVSRHVPGGRLVLSWELQEPEEDPGLVQVVMVRAHYRVLVFSTGQEIFRDPRKMSRLEPSVRELTAIARDPRLAPRTTRAAVRAGRHLTYWDPQGAP